MKIAFVNQPWTVASPPDQCDSIASWTYQVAHRLAASCDVIFYGRRSSSQKRFAYFEQGINYRSIPVFLDKLIRLFRLLDRWGVLSPQRSFFASRLYYLGYILQVANDLREQQCDVVHVHNFSQFVPIIRAFNPGVKIVLHMHCEWLTQLDWSMIERRLSQVDLVVGCSEYITEKVRNSFPQFAGRCQTVFNGVDIDRFTSRNGHNVAKGKNTKQLLFVGRISPEKGVHVLLDAFQEVATYYPQVQLKIVGPESIISKEFLVGLSTDPKVSELASFYSGGYLSHLQNRLSPDLANQIWFTGAVPHHQLLNHYWEADILINPSLSEAFGMSLVESMAVEVPVIAARTGGMIDVVKEGKTGLLVEPASAEALAKAIIYLLSNEDLRQSMGKAGRDHVLEHFSWEKVTESLLSQYKNVCESHEHVISKDSAAAML